MMKLHFNYDSLSKIAIILAGIIFTIVGFSKLTNLPADFATQRRAIMLACFGPDFVDAADLILGILQLSGGLTLLLSHLISSSSLQHKLRLGMSGVLILTMLVGLSCQLSSGITDIPILPAIGFFILSIIVFILELLLTTRRGSKMKSVSMM